MKEELVSFETAKLAKEKGFDIPVIYGVFGKKTKLTENHGWEKNRRLELKNWNKKGLTSYSIPTQSLLQKWLREVYGIDITISIRFADSYGVHIHKNRNLPPNFEEIIVDVTPENHRKVYENALEIGLQEGLKLAGRSKKGKGKQDRTIRKIESYLEEGFLTQEDL